MCRTILIVTGSTGEGSRRAVSRKTVLAVVSLVAVALGIGWATRASAQCSKDIDCEGKRVCDRGFCVDPASIVPATQSRPSIYGKPAVLPTDGTSAAAQPGAPTPPVASEGFPTVQSQVTVSIPAVPPNSGGEVVAPQAPVPFPAPASPSIAYPIHDEAAAANEPPMRSTGGSKGLRVTGIVCAAAGITSIAAGVGFYVRARSLSDSVGNASTFDPGDNDSGKQAETLQWVFYSVGAVSVATGVLLYLLGRPSSSSANVYASIQASPLLLPGRRRRNLSYRTFFGEGKRALLLPMLGFRQDRGIE